MTETKKTLVILRDRWPEVFLIIGLFTLGDISQSLFNFGEPDLTSTKLALLSMFFFVSLTVISTLLNFGFLRTVHLEGPKKQTPKDLIKTGSHFFWRMVGFGIFYGIIFIIIVTIIFLIFKNLTSIETGFWESSNTNSLLYSLCLATTMLILIKIPLFVPAIIIVLDCRVFDGFRFLRKCTLSESKELVTLYLLGAAMLILKALLKIPNYPETISQYISRIGTTVIEHFLWLIIAITAVRFVSSLNLVYDIDKKELNSEDLLKNPTED